MRILSHRGYWKTPDERNTVAAFRRSFALGFGTETDVRDATGRLVISHDPPAADALPIEELFGVHRATDPSLPLALNIKADGLHEMLRDALAEVKNYFVFDMSIPDARAYVRTGMRVFTRHSEWEPRPAFYDEACGVWLDGFFGEWFHEADIAGHLGRGKQVCVVSPELHARPHRPLWERLASMACVERDDLMLCTDYPEEARGLFRGQD